MFKDHLKQIESGEAEKTVEPLRISNKNIRSSTPNSWKMQPQTKVKPWISDEVLKLAEEKSNLRKKRTSPELDQRYKELRSEI